MNEDSASSSSLPFLDNETGMDDAIDADDEWITVSRHQRTSKPHQSYFRSKRRSLENSSLAPSFRNHCGNSFGRTSSTTAITSHQTSSGHGSHGLRDRSSQYSGYYASRVGQGTNTTTGSGAAAGASAPNSANTTAGGNNSNSSISGGSGTLGTSPPTHATSLFAAGNAQAISGTTSVTVTTTSANATTPPSLPLAATTELPAADLTLQTTAGTFPAHSTTPSSATQRASGQASTNSSTPLVTPATVPYAAVVAGKSALHSNSATATTTLNTTSSTPTTHLTTIATNANATSSTQSTTTAAEIDSTLTTAPTPTTEKTRNRSTSQLSRDALPYSPSYMTPGSSKTLFAGALTPALGATNLSAQFLSAAGGGFDASTVASSSDANVSGPASATFAPTMAANVIAPLTLVPAALAAQLAGSRNGSHSNSTRHAHVLSKTPSVTAASPLLSPKLAANVKLNSHLAFQMEMQHQTYPQASDQTSNSSKPSFLPGSHAIPSVGSSASTSPVLAATHTSRPASGTVSPAVGASNGGESWRVVGAYANDSETSESYDDSDDNQTEDISSDTESETNRTKRSDSAFDKRPEHEEVKRTTVYVTPPLGISAFGSASDPFAAEYSSSHKIHRWRRIIRRIPLPLQTPPQPQPQSHPQSQSQSQTTNLTHLRSSTQPHPSPSQQPMLASPLTSDPGLDSPPASFSATSGPELALSSRRSVGNDNEVVSSSRASRIESSPGTEADVESRGVPESIEAENKPFDDAITRAATPELRFRYETVKTFENDIDTEFDYLIILDLEATCDAPSPDGRAPLVTRETQEIIEFPWILFDIKTQSIVETHRRFVKPVHSMVTTFCTKLTGITQNDVDTKGELLQDVLASFERYYFEKFPDLSSQRRVALVTDGYWDFKVQLLGEALKKGLRIPRIFRSFVNLQSVFAQFYAKMCVKRKPNLKYMASFLNVELSGHHHTGIDDCHSICTILKCMLTAGLRLTRRSLEKVSRTYNPWADPGIRDFNITNAGTAAMLGLGSPLYTSGNTMTQSGGEAVSLSPSGSLNPLSPLAGSPPIPPSTSADLPPAATVTPTGLAALGLTPMATSQGITPITTSQLPTSGSVPESSGTPTINASSTGSQTTTSLTAPSTNTATTTTSNLLSTLVQIRGLPWGYTDLDIYAFFSGLHIRGGGIIHLMNAQGQPSGSAVVDFASIEETVEALKRHRRLMGHRFIEVTACPENMVNELRTFLSRQQAGNSSATTP